MCPRTRRLLWAGEQHSCITPKHCGGAEHRGEGPLRSCGPSCLASVQQGWGEGLGGSRQPWLGLQLQLHVLAAVCCGWPHLLSELHGLQLQPEAEVGGVWGAVSLSSLSGAAGGPAHPSNPTCTAHLTHTAHSMELRRGLKQRVRAALGGRAALGSPEGKASACTSIHPPIRLSIHLSDRHPLPRSNPAGGLRDTVLLQQLVETRQMVGPCAGGCAGQHQEPHLPQAVTHCTSWHCLAQRGHSMPCHAGREQCHTCSAAPTAPGWWFGVHPLWFHPLLWGFSAVGRVSWGGGGLGRLLCNPTRPFIAAVGAGGTQGGHADISYRAGAAQW